MLSRGRGTAVIAPLTAGRWPSASWTWGTGHRRRCHPHTWARPEQPTRALALSGERSLRCPASGETGKFNLDALRARVVAASTTYRRGKPPLPTRGASGTGLEEVRTFTKQKIGSYLSSNPTTLRVLFRGTLKQQAHRQFAALQQLTANLQIAASFVLLLL